MVNRIVFVLVQNCHGHGCLRLPVELHEDGSKFCNALFQACRRYSGCAVYQGFQTAEVMVLSHRRVKQDVDHGGNHESAIDLVALNQCAKSFNIKARVHDDRARAHEHWRNQGASGVGDGCHCQKARVGWPIKIGHLHHHHGHHHTVVVQHALGFAGGATGINQNAVVIFLAA